MPRGKKNKESARGDGSKASEPRGASRDNARRRRLDDDGRLSLKSKLLKQAVSTRRAR